MPSSTVFTGYFASIESISLFIQSGRVDILIPDARFPNEIEGYRQTIIEKTTLIEKGVEVLSNKRRVEILNKKINDLLVLKKKFESNSRAVTNKKKTQFLERCREILEQHQNKNQNIESLLIEEGINYKIL